MGRLKRYLVFPKIKASSITETIVATTIISIVFAITILSLNNILQNVIENDTSAIEQKINKFIYESNYEKVITPGSFEEGDWIVNIEKKEQNDFDIIEVEAFNRKTKKTLTKSIIYNEN